MGGGDYRPQQTDSVTDKLVDFRQYLCTPRKVGTRRFIKEIVLNIYDQQRMPVWSDLVPHAVSPNKKPPLPLRFGWLDELKPIS